MTKEELLRKLKECQESDDPEIAHDEADIALIRYINDKDIASEYDKIIKWYA